MKDFKDKVGVFKKEDWEMHLMFALDDEDFETAAHIRDIAGEPLELYSMDDLVNEIAEKLREEGIC